ncbi:phage repressor [Acidithiobacillus sp. GGI-221]|nr:phage repressor [Acidithiobacillus sp. GGI-221]
MTSVVDPYSLGACSREIAVSEVVSDSAFALEIKGDSMLPEYHEGDIVIIDPAVTPQPGDYVVVKNQEEEATFKKYRPRGRNDRGEEYFEVVPLNPDYPTLRSDVDSLYIVGTEVEHHKLRSRRRSHSRC